MKQHSRQPSGINSISSFIQMAVSKITSSTAVYCIADDQTTRPSLRTTFLMMSTTKTTNRLNQKNDQEHSWVQRMKVLKMFKLDLRKLKSKMTTRKLQKKELLVKRRKRRRSQRNKEIQSTTDPIELMMETARVTCRNKFSVDSKVLTGRITSISSLKSFILII